MRLGIFNKRKKEDNEKEKSVPEVLGSVEDANTNKNKEDNKNTTFENLKGGSILIGFFVSEKASMGNASGQYVFKVSKGANKSEIKKQVNGMFNVNVRDVKIINLPRKRRDLGRHPGFKSGFKKAIVILEKGQTINQTV